MLFFEIPDSPANPTSRQVGYFVANSYDVILFLVIVFSILILFIAKILKLVMKCFSSSSLVTNDKEEKKLIKISKNL
jgi:hypothetical protein